MILSGFAVVALVGLFAGGVCLLAAAWFRGERSTWEAQSAWRPYRFGFATYGLVFLVFDMEMIFMYPWAVVFGEIGMTAVLGLFVFIGLLAGGIAYAWGMGGLEWE